MWLAIEITAAVLFVAACVYAEFFSRSRKKIERNPGLTANMMLVQEAWHHNAGDQSTGGI
ncbi:hypothetical protein [Nocardioides panacisoli]|uniref:Uncharacterized protein n=1 Tax=Nocardioides panacisoli TaxID=627624 RepID=A0ABP7HWR4_9ACTN